MGSFTARAAGTAQTADTQYKVGPLDTLNISVWRNPDLSGTVLGAIARTWPHLHPPLVPDLLAAGRISPGKEIAHDIETALLQDTCASRGAT